MKRLVAAVVLNCLWIGLLPAQAPRPDRAEECVKLALKYLHDSQDADGAWRLYAQKSPGVTSLAVMAFLSAGHVPGEGPYGDSVTRGIRWVLDAQKADGLFLSPQRPGFAMYEHGISTLMLAEVAGMTDAALSRRIKQAVEKAVAVILKAQRRDGLSAGGWRYQVTGTDADVSVTGWQLLALRAVRSRGCDVPAERIDRALEFLKRCEDARTGGFRYTPGGELTVACTGTAILCLELCRGHQTPEALRAGSHVLQHLLRWDEINFFYSAYYCSQATFQLGGNYWNYFRPELRKALLPYQQPNGSWSGRDGFGAAYGTSMSVLALTVEYRYLPIYQRGDDSSRANANE